MSVSRIGINNGLLVRILGPNGLVNVKGVFLITISSEKVVNTDSNLVDSHASSVGVCSMFWKVVNSADMWKFMGIAGCIERLHYEATSRLAGIEKPNPVHLDISARARKQVVYIHSRHWGPSSLEFSLTLSSSERQNLLVNCSLLRVICLIPCLNMAKVRLTFQIKLAVSYILF